MLDTVRIIVLAGGLGKRMGGELPKVLTPLNGKPIVGYLVAELKKLALSQPPTIIVGSKAEMVKEYLGPDFHYVLQAEQLGTGHAVGCARESLQGTADTIVTLYGDHPLVSARMVERLVAKHQEEDAVMTLGVVKVPDFSGWREALINFGRVIRNPDGTVGRIVEVKDATEEEKQITEVNPSYFCFSAKWLWENITKLENTNAQHEYYLTDLLKAAFDQGQKVATIHIEAEEALGINTPAELAKVSELMKSREN
ncbi:MAG: NTP transferase domain-containing protein [bacterium]|nr:NTP transferase domain-containing protein [bacterium]